MSLFATSSSVSHDTDTTILKMDVCHQCRDRWLLLVALPAFRPRADLPIGMVTFFVAWVIVLPFLIDWKLDIR